MRLTVPTLRKLVSLAAGMLLLGCSHPPHLTREAATRRAMTAAVNEGYVLREYKLPVVLPPEGTPAKWTLQFDALDGKPEHHFVVSVDDRTGDAQVVPAK